MGKISDLPEVTNIISDSALLAESDAAWDGSVGTSRVKIQNMVSSLIDYMGNPNWLEDVRFCDLGEFDPGSQERLLTMDDKLILNNGRKSSAYPITHDNLNVDAVTLLWYLIDEAGSLAMRKKIWRGRYLGNKVTAEQYTNIKNGTFKGLMLGDYWTLTIGGQVMNLRIVDFDYWYGSGEPTKCTTNHVVLMPEDVLNIPYTDLITTEMHTRGDIDAGKSGYANSQVRSKLSTFENMLKNVFGASHLLNHREYLINSLVRPEDRINVEYPYGGAWYDSICEIPNECMIYGCGIFGPSGRGDLEVNRLTIDLYQLAGARVNQDILMPSGEKSYWLRDPALFNTYAVYVGETGTAHYVDVTVSDTVYMRPVFAICG